MGPTAFLSANKVYSFVLFLYLDKRKGLKASSIANGKTLVYERLLMIAAAR